MIGPLFVGSLPGAPGASPSPSAPGAQRLRGESAGFAESLRSASSRPSDDGRASERRSVESEPAGAQPNERADSAGNAERDPSATNAETDASRADDDPRPEASSKPDAPQRADDADAEGDSAEVEGNSAEATPAEEGEGQSETEAPTAPAAPVSPPAAAPASEDATKPADASQGREQSARAAKAERVATGPAPSASGAEQITAQQSHAPPDGDASQTGASSRDAVRAGAAGGAPATVSTEKAGEGSQRAHGASPQAEAPAGAPAASTTDIEASTDEHHRGSGEDRGASERLRAAAGAAAERAGRSGDFDLFRAEAPRAAQDAGAPQQVQPSIGEGARHQGVRLESVLPGARSAANAGQGAGPADDSAATQAVQRGLGAAIRQQGGSVTVRLSPESLGQVRIQMQIQHGAVEVRIEAATEQARELLTRHADMLRTTLQQKGFGVERIEVQTAPPQHNSGARSGADGAADQQEARREHDTGDGRSRGAFDQRRHDERPDQRWGRDDEPLTFEQMRLGVNATA